MAGKRKRRKLKRGAAKFLICMLLICVLAATALTAPVFNIKTISVSGIKLLKAENVIKLAEITKGDHLFRTSMKKAKKKLFQNPFIKEVNVKRKLPSGVEIIIGEEILAAYVVNGGNFVGINADGKVLEVTKKAREGILKMPSLKVSESKAGEIIKYKNVNYLDIQRRCLESITENGLLEKATELNISNSSSIKLTLEGGLVAVLGGTGEMDYKLKLVNTVLSEGYSNGIFNVENPAQPTFRKNQ